MDRNDLDNWFTHHPETIHTRPEERTADLLDECESRIKAYAYRDAWIRAGKVAEETLHRFEGGFGLPASEPFVTREICHEVARELKHHEPHPDEIEEDEWLRQSFLDALDAEPRRMLREWLGELAEKEEHAVWQEIVYFTDHIAKTLIREGHMTDVLNWDFERSYPKVAARVVRMLIREFEAHAVEESRTASGAQ